MKVLLITTAVLGILVGGAGTLCWMVFILSAMPNSSPQQEANLWRFFWAVGAGGVLCAAGAIALVVFERPGWGIVAGVTPVAAFIGFMILALAWPT